MIVNAKRKIKKSEKSLDFSNPCGNEKESW